ncbi:MAG: molecular chaperone DnaJ [Baekduia sp.]
MSQTQPRDPYDVLGVGRSADEGEIKKAFRRLARELHPDTNPDDPDAEERFKEVAEAYEILSDAERRATFDRYGHDGLKAGGFRPHPEDFGSLSDILGAIFGDVFGGGAGGRAGGPRQGQDLGVQLELTLAEAYAGVTRDVEVQVVERCGRCHGNAAEPGTPLDECERCGGHGVLQSVVRTPFGQAMRQVECDACGGDGRIPQSPCEQCNGRGVVATDHTLAVDVPAGIDDGQRLRLAGRGHAGERGGPPGDLYVLVSVAPQEDLLRDGDDLVAVADVAATAAALGTTVAIAHPSGDLVTVEIPAGTQPATVIAESGRGMPSLSRPGRSGDLRIVVNVVVPRRLTGEQERLFEELAESITDEQLRSGESIGAKLRRLFHR